MCRENSRLPNISPNPGWNFGVYTGRPMVVSKITGLKSQIDGKEINGWLIGVPMTAKQMIENRDLAKNGIKAA